MSESGQLGSHSMRMTAEEIIQRGFPTKVRGISETEVRSFLKRVAAEVERLGAREDELEAQIEALENSSNSKPKVSKHELLENLGEQTARVLSSAEEAAELMMNEAREKSEKMVSEAKQKADELVKRAQAKSDTQLEDIHARVRSLHESAERDVDTLVEEARVFGREIFQESVVVREQILKDLLRRRDLLLEQIEELRRGREELLESYKVVKGSFQKATDALHAVEEKASSELLANPIDVDALLKAPVELPGVLESGQPVPQRDISPETGNKSQNDKPVVVVSEESAQAEVPEQPEQTPSLEDQEVPTITGKKKSLKKYMKGALGVGEEQKPSVINPDDVESGIAQESAVIKIVAPTQEEPKVESQDPSGAQAAPKKDVGELFKSLKEQKSDPKKEKVITKTKPENSEPDGSVKTAAKTEKTTKKASKKKSTQNPIEIRDEKITEIMSSILRKAKRQLQDEQNELLEALRTVKPKKRVAAENILIDEQTQIKIWEEVVREDLDVVFQAGATSVSQDKVTYEDDLMKSAVGWIVAPLRETLTLAIDEGEQDDAATRVGARYREWRNTDLKNALYDAMSSAYNNGVVAGAKKGATAQWKVAKAGQCPDCDDNALEPTQVGEAFPTGQVAPPAHAGCKCVLVVA